MTTYDDIRNSELRQAVIHAELELAAKHAAIHHMTESELIEALLREFPGSFIIGETTNRLRVLDMLREKRHAVDVTSTKGVV